MTTPLRHLLILIVLAAGCDTGGLLIATARPAPTSTAGSTGGAATSAEAASAGGAAGQAPFIDAQPEGGAGGSGGAGEAGDAAPAPDAPSDAPPSCTPSPCGDGDCGQADDGCGGFKDCDPTCGDGLWMSCTAGRCACWALPKEAPYLPAFSACKAAQDGTSAFFCGAPSADIPPGCFQAGVEILGTPAWCCPI